MVKEAAGPGLPALSHLYVEVRDLAAAYHFYVELLGLEALVGGPDSGYLRVGGRDGFHVGIEENLGLGEVDAGIEIVIRVEDVDATWARLGEAGVATGLPPADQEWGMRHAWLRDPSGHRLSIYSPNRGDTG